LAERALIEADPRRVTAILAVTTSGDDHPDWSLQQEGGKGLFTKEIEDALLAGEADVAVHSAKDLPTTMHPELEIAAYLPRENPADTLVVRTGVDTPARIATGSPRRRAQLARLFPEATFSELRGNVQTRLRKIAEGQADATVLAAAGLHRLGIHHVEGVRFRELPYPEMVPASGQGAIALQCRRGEAGRFAGVGDPNTTYAVRAEKCFLASLGGGCHAAFAGFLEGDTFFHAFHDKHGYHTLELPGLEPDAFPDFFAEHFRTWIDTES
jgi:hydroxymethylbilane synthase